MEFVESDPDVVLHHNRYTPLRANTMGSGSWWPKAASYCKCLHISIILPVKGVTTAFKPLVWKCFNVFFFSWPPTQKSAVLIHPVTDALSICTLFILVGEYRQGRPYLLICKRARSPGWPHLLPVCWSTQRQQGSQTRFIPLTAINNARSP